MTFMVLTESTLPRLLWNAALGKRVCVIALRSLIGGTTRHLEWLAKHLQTRGLLIWISDLRPDLIPFTDYGDLMRIADPFVDAEAWVCRFFAFDHAENQYGEYATAYRHLCCNAVFQRFGAAHICDGVVSEGLAVEASIYGLDTVDRSYYRERFLSGLSCGSSKHGPTLFMNFALLFSVMVKSSLWIFRRLRLSPPSPKSVFMGSDFTGGGHDNHLWDEVIDGGGDVMAVMRNSGVSKAHAGTTLGYPHCETSDGWFTLGKGLVAWVEVLRSGFRLFCRGRHLPPDFFRKLIVLPHKRMVYRALFNRYHFSYFWSRDEYNSDHIVRSQELRKVGGKSIGIMHGIPSICILTHQCRYLDFDQFYMLGQDQYDRLYYSTWPSHMTVRSIGSFGLSREEMKKMADLRPNNIVCFLSPSYHHETIMAGIENIARRFPDRTVFLNIKSKKYIAGQFGKALSRLLSRAPANLVLDERRSYELLFDCQYVINESSTLTAEAAQFGHFAFVLDPDPRTKNLYYRQIPEICLASSEKIAARICQIEAGEWRYPRELFSSIINLKGPISWDVIRADMGLTQNGVKNDSATGKPIELLKNKA